MLSRCDVFFNKTLVIRLTYHETISSVIEDSPGWVGGRHLLCKCWQGRATQRGPIFRVCLGTGVYSIVLNSGRGAQVYLSRKGSQNFQRGTIFALQGFFLTANFVLGLTDLKRCKQFDIL